MNKNAMSCPLFDKQRGECFIPDTDHIFKEWKGDFLIPLTGPNPT
jgi:hypothetical protein